MRFEQSDGENTPATTLPDYRGLLDFAKTFKDGVASGFKSIDSAPAVVVYQKEDDYVVSVDLAAGAELEIVQGDTVASGKSSVYGGPNPDFKRMSSDQALAKERAINPDAVCAVNAEFFANFNRAAVPVAFPVRQDGVTVSEGFAAVDKHVGNRLTLAFSKGFASIIPFNNSDISEFRNLKENDVQSFIPGSRRTYTQTVWRWTNNDAGWGLVEPDDLERQASGGQFPHCAEFYLGYSCQSQVVPILTQASAIIKSSVEFPQAN